MVNERSTIEDVAKAAGVSIATVSRVLNNTGKVADATRTRVMSAVGALGYSPSAAARSLAARRTYTIGLTVHTIDGDYFQHMLQGAEDAASQHGYTLMLYTTRSVKRFQLGRHNADGAIIFADSQADRRLAEFHATGFPVVLLHRSPPDGMHMPFVTVENKKGARMMTDHLIENCGRTRIAFLRGPDDQEDSYWREMGYRESLAAHGIAFDPVLVGRGEFVIEHARETVRGWLRDKLPIDAIFAGDDESALGAMMALHEKGVRCPADIAVTGFDDIRLAQYLNPPLTTVRAPIEAAAAEAVYQLVKLINGEPAAPKTLLATELVVRESCGWRLKLRQGASS
jgi:LacI family transcriptional regulator